MDKASFLLHNPVLDRMGFEALHRAVGRAGQVKMDRRAELWSAGQPVTALYFIRSGVVSERVRIGTAREFVLGFRGKGEVVGEVAALTAALTGEGNHATSACVHEEATLYQLPLVELVTQVRADPNLGLALAALSAERRKRSEDRLARAMFRSVPSRMASVLLDLADTFGVRDSRGVIVNLRLTHRDLAAMAGASRETASVALLDWRRDGLVEIDSKRVVVLDVERLVQLADA